MDTIKTVTLWAVNNSLWIMGIIFLTNILIFELTSRWFSRKIFLTTEDSATILKALFIIPAIQLIFAAILSLLVASLAVFVDCHQWFAWIAGGTCLNFPKLTFDSILLFFKCVVLLISIEIVTVFHCRIIWTIIKKKLTW